MSISIRFNVLRAIMAVEINEKFAALAVDIDRQFDELAGKYAPVAIHGIKYEAMRAELAALRGCIAASQNGFIQAPQQAAYHRAMEAQNQFGGQFRNALDAQAGLFNYGTRPYYPIN